MDAIITDGLYFPPSFTGAVVFVGPPISAAEDTTKLTILPPRITEAINTAISGPRIVKAEDTST